MALAEALAVPVATSLNGKDVIPGNHPLSVGELPKYLLIQNHSAVELVDHIETTHHAYLHRELPRLTALSDKVLAAHGARHPELAELSLTLGELRADLDLVTRKLISVLNRSYEEHGDAEADRLPAGRGGVGAVGVGELGGAEQGPDFLGDAGGRQHEVDAAGGDGAARHAVERRRGRLLGERDSSFAFDGFKTQGPVRGRAGKHDAD